MAVVATSCTKDVLDKKPLGLITEETVWKDQVLMESFLSQIYFDCQFMENDQNQTSGDLLSNWFGRFMINEVSDECYTQWVPIWSSFKWGNLTVAGGLLEWWEPSYKINRKINEFLERVPSAPVDDNFKKQRIAEARFLRAYNYFTLVKRYGGVPLITKLQNIDDPKEELAPARNKEAEIYDFIISELDAIKDVLPDQQSGDDVGRPSKYAALSLQSRAALYAASIAQFGTVQLNGIVGIPAGKSQAYYQKAYDAAKAIKESNNFRLYNRKANKAENFRSLFLDEAANPEAIFTIIHNESPRESGGRGTVYDYFEAPQPNFWGLGNQDMPYLEMAEEFELIDGSSGKLNRAQVQQGLWTMADLWKNKDPRFFASIYTNETPWKGGLLDYHKGLVLPDGTIQMDGSYQGQLANGNQNVNGTSFGVLKYLDESNKLELTTGDSKTDYLVFRYGETLLNLAEAAFELGKTGEALDAINEIRTRAGIASLAGIDRTKIRHERKVELFAEGHRYWDVRRWRTAKVDLSINQSGIQYIKDVATGKYKIVIRPNIDPTTTPPKFSEQNYYFPITVRRTAQNPNLVENPGYQ
jgi:hypothetical protein